MGLYLNKKEYQDNCIFKKNFIEEYCNLDIYPLVGILEKEAGLLSDIASHHSYPVNCIVYGNSELESIQFFKDNLQNFNPYGKVLISYIHESISDFNNIVLTDFVLSPENDIFKGYKKIKIHNNKTVA